MKNLQKNLASPPKTLFVCEWKKVVIWGAGKNGELCIPILDKHVIEILNFVDRTPPEGGVFCGYPVIESNEFLAQPQQLVQVDAIIFAMLSDHAPMKLQLRAQGYAGAFATFHEGMDESSLLTQKKRFFPQEALAGDNGANDLRLLTRIGEVLEAYPRLALFGQGETTTYLLKQLPKLASKLIAIIERQPIATNTPVAGVPLLTPENLPELDAIWITSPRYLDQLDARHTLFTVSGKTAILDWQDIISALPAAERPHHACHDIEFNIYPLPIPPITFESGKDFILIDPPARFLGLMPNGLGYVHNILNKTGINFQTVDLDMIFYHRFHSRRLLDSEPPLTSPSGVPVHTDPWGVTSVEDFWYKPDFVEFFRPEIDRCAEELIKANPKILGISLHGTNRVVGFELIRRMRAARPEMVIVVGGYDCNSAKNSPDVVEDYDFMVIFEAENSLPPLVNAILSGKKYINIAGVVTKKNPLAKLANSFVPSELPEDLDAIDFPKYDWADIRLYRNFNNYQLIPIVLSRGCRWSRCTFCGERFHWRRRSPESVADEIEWFTHNGGRLFHFNDSDLSGDPGAVRGVCEEVIRRGIKGITMVGQLRVQKGYTQEYFEVLKEAGFANLRYGIDGWSKRTLKLHKKGYTLDMIEEVLTHTKNAGIGIGINLVIGIPGETEEDIDETIANIIKNRDKFDLIENLNTLILTTASVYWTDLDKFGIVLHGDKDDLEKRYPRTIPTSLWHSVNPYIDQTVRRDRLERILDTTAAFNIKIGGYANRTAKQLTSKT